MDRDHIQNNLTYGELMRMIISLSVNEKYKEATMVASFAAKKFPERVFSRGSPIKPVDTTQKPQDLNDH